MKLLLMLTPLSLLTILTACGEKKADLDAPNSHQIGGGSFEYPRNWKITDDSETDGFHQIFVETPGDAIVILQSFWPEAAESVLDYAKRFSTDAASETSIGTVSKSGFEELPESHGFSRVREDFSISLLGESVPHQRIYASKLFGERRIYAIFQSATEDVSKVEPGFELIIDTFKAQK